MIKDKLILYIQQHVRTWENCGILKGTQGLLRSEALINRRKRFEWTRMGERREVYSSNRTEQ
jgi:hypothetical protein